jgi:DNA polymerase-3 subunit delta'
MMTTETTGQRWPVYGHDWAVGQLARSLAYGRVRHAYLITGADQIGKHTLAHAFAMTLNCAAPDQAARPCGQCRPCRLIQAGGHPDILYGELDENTGALRIDAIRTVTRALAMKPFEARYRVAIFPHFERAQPRAQDALLKTLEEPPPHAVLILLAPATEALLPTIVSRSQVIALRPVPLALIRDMLVTHYQAEPDHAELLARLSAGRIGWAISALHDDTLQAGRDTALDLLEACLSQTRAQRFALAEDLSRDKLALAHTLALWQTYWRDLLLLAAGSQVPPANSDRLVPLQRLALSLSPADALRGLKATRALLDNLAYNLNLRLALEVLFLEYPGLQRE